MCQSLAIDVWGEHSSSTCKFRTVECHFCKKSGHITKACRSNKDKTSHKSTRPQKQTKITHYMGEEENIKEPVEQDNSYHLFTLWSNGQNSITVKVELNNVPIETEVDTVQVHQCHLLTSISMIQSQAKLIPSHCKSQVKNIHWLIGRDSRSS